MQTYSQEYIYMHLKDTNVFMLSIISVAQKLVLILNISCAHAILLAAVKVHVCASYASPRLFLANARMSLTLIYTTHATQLLHSLETGDRRKAFSFFAF